jgi:hypothetical protein
MMFISGANRLLLLSRTECLSYAVSLPQDRDTQRVYRFTGLTKAQQIRPNVAHYLAGKANSAAKLNLVIDPIRPGTKHARRFTVPIPADGAGGSGMG